MIESGESDLGLIVSYILECKGRSQISYQDYAIIERWLATAIPVDELLLLLSDLLPDFFESAPQRSLVMIDKKVNKVIRLRLDQARLS